MRERNTPGLIRVGDMEMAGIGAMGVTEIDAVGTTETNIVGTAEIGAEGTTRIGDTGAAGEVVVGISMFAATPGSSKVSAIRGMDMQNEGRP